MTSQQTSSEGMRVSLIRSANFSATPSPGFECKKSARKLATWVRPGYIPMSFRTDLATDLEGSVVTTPRSDLVSQDRHTLEAVTQNAQNTSEKIAHSYIRP